MKYLSLSTIFLLICATQVAAVSLGVPLERDILFEPGKQISLQYRAGNSEPTPITAKIQYDAGLLPITINLPDRITLPPKGEIPLKVEFTLPQTLPPGVYPVSFELAEDSGNLGGFGAVLGVKDIIHIISPFETAHPYVKLLAAKKQQPGTPLSFNLEIQNIGKAVLTEYTVEITLTREAEELATLSRALPLLKPFEKRTLTYQFDTTEHEPGEYKLKALIKSNGAEQALESVMTIGTPDITVINKPSVRAGTENQFALKLQVTNWKTPIQGLLRAGVGNLFRSEQQATLQPGENEILITGHINDAKTGTYTGQITFYGLGFVKRASFDIDVEGNIDSKGSFAFAGQASEPPEMEAPATASMPQPEKSKINIFILILLVASFTIFAFMLGQYFAQRKNDTAPPPP